HQPRGQRRMSEDRGILATMGRGWRAEPMALMVAGAMMLPLTGLFVLALAALGFGQSTMLVPLAALVQVAGNFWIAGYRAGK
ncbi:MAG: hypothetical protein Q4F71_09380, partial [Paracoccus sp. (in: a-proteobacteria)]|nr:hypothetical protein [Paracoccus sp. (in: a-proteobacteria)]